MDFAQRRVLQIQGGLIFLTLLKFLVPFGDILSFNSYLISIPSTLSYMTITLGGLILGLVLNAKNEASFKSAYFVGSLFFPLLWGINIFIELFDLLINEGFFSSFALISSLYSFVVVGIYLYYAIFYNDPLDWTSHKVEKFSIQFNYVGYVIAGIFTLVLFFLNLFLNSRVSSGLLDDAAFVNRGLLLSFPLIWFVIIWFLLVGLMNSSVLVIFRDRLYFFTALTISMFSSLIAFNMWGITDVVFNIVDAGFGNLGDDGYLIVYTIFLYVFFPIVLITMTRFLHQKNKLRLVPYASHSNHAPNFNRADSSNQSEFSSTYDTTHLANGYNDHDDKSTTDYSNPTYNNGSEISFGNFNISRNVLFMVAVHLATFIIFLVGFNSNIYTIAANSDVVSFSFGELIELIEILEIFGDSTSISLLLGFYTFLIFVVQVALMFLQIKLRPSFKNTGFIALLITHGVHLLALFIGFVLVGITINDFNEAFNSTIIHWVGFGVLVQLVITVLGVFLYSQGDVYLPQIFESISKFDLSFASAGQNNSQDRPARPTPRPAPAPGSRPAPRLEPVPGNRPGRPAPRPKPMPEPRTVIASESSSTPRPTENLKQDSSSISNLETTLAALKRLLDEGLITEEEYNAKKKEQLDKL